MRKLLVLFLVALWGYPMMAAQEWSKNSNYTTAKDSAMSACPNDFVVDFIGLEVTFIGFVEDEGDATYAWDFGDNTTGEGAEIMHQYLEEGSYEVSLTTVLNDTCEYVSTRMIEVWDNGGGNDSTMSDCTNNFGYEAIDLNVAFTGFVEAEGDATYAWDFGDNTTGQGAEIMHQYLEEGFYEVSLTTVLNDTCEFTSTQMIGVWDNGGGNDSTMNACVNNFVADFMGLEVTFIGFVEGEGDVTYAWDFGDNTTGQGAEVTHQYIEEGSYEVSLTTILNDTCEYVSTRMIEVWDNGGGNDSTVMISGHVSVENQFIDAGVVSLYAVVADTIGGQNDIVLLDNVSTDEYGTYEFHDVTYNKLLILAAPKETSAHYETALPTYYGNVVNWMDATIVVIEDNNGPIVCDIDLQLAEGASDGQGQISGNLVGEEVKARLSNDNELVLHLLDENQNILTFTYSAVNDNFDFSNLAFGQYTVYTEAIGLPTYPNVVTLNADNPTAEIQIYVNSTEVTTGIDDIANVEIQGNVYPNPVSTFAQVDLNILETSEVELSIINQLGQVMESKIQRLNKGKHTFTFDAHNYPSGLYFIQIQSEKANITKKFIKQ